MRIGRIHPGNRRRILAAAMLAASSTLLAPLRGEAQSIEQQCAVTLRVEGKGALGALELKVGYNEANGEFAGAGPDVDCQSIVPEALAFENDEDADRQLDLGMISSTGVVLPVDFWRCTFVTSAGVPTADVFSLSVDEAVGIDMSPLAVDAVVGSIACESEAVCGNGLLETDEECDDEGESLTCTGDCRLQPDLQVCRILFRSDGDDVLGGLQFTVDYSAAEGDFEGTATAVECTETIESALTARNDRDAEAELELAFLSPTGIPASSDLWECRFLTAAGEPQRSDFVFTDVSATDLALVEVPVTMSADVVECLGGPVCGDGFVEGDEECDDGNLVNTDACVGACQAAECHDGFVQSGVEECDDGNLTNTDACVGACQIAECHDGFVRSGVEECDDGNLTNTDACVGACQIAECHDGFVRSGVEECDDGNLTNTDACVGACQTAECHDGFVQSGVEECDDGNLANTDACVAVCQIAECHDGFVRSGVEECDDGNLTNTDACVGACQIAECHDGFVQSGVEECDDGNLANADECVAECQFAECHDGFVQSGVEECDDGNLANTDACVGACQIAECPDGFVQTGVEECDDANTVAGDGCSAACTIEALCGDADGNHTVNAADALRILKKAVGQPVSCPSSACDADGSGAVTAPDALRILRKAVGLAVVLNCPS